MLRQMPPLEAVEAFLTAARSRSFRAAATSLALSPSAFSRRIQLLERFTGRQLFERSGAAAILSTDGEHYLVNVDPAIEAILQATNSLRQVGGDGGALRMATSHSMAAEWLMPRLPKLLSETGIALELTVSRDPESLRSQAVDVALWGGPTPEKAPLADVIANLDAVPVAAPRLFDDRSPPRTPDDLAEQPLIEVRANAGLWRLWLRKAGYRGPPPEVTARYDTNQLKNEAAASGLGVALATPMVAERFLADRRLVAFTRMRLPTDQSYCLHYANKDVRLRRGVQALLSWLRTEAQASLRRYDRWYEAEVCS
ncbi:LysR substrate-binding domain-containing protein [Sphingomonas sp.]|uniref:LysR substrate-binding domain-containing protein n=1 Tax=Sphingomonas sp. TaxID=28214 RepID=UPI003D6D5BEA